MDFFQIAAKHVGQDPPESNPVVNPGAQFHGRGLPQNAECQLPGRLIRSTFMGEPGVWQSPDAGDESDRLIGGEEDQIFPLQH